MSEKPTIGFIGVGFMGHGLAANILKNGYPLVIKGNRNRTPVDDLVEKGAVEADTIETLMKSAEIIHLCLSNSNQVETVLTGAGGIIEHARAGVIVIDTSTSDPESSLRMSSALKKVGMEFVDAPLGRTPKEAALGTVDALVGADDHVFEIVKPIIASWSATVTHLGAVGSGHKMKLIMNFLAMSYGALYSEATVLAAKSGISPQKVNDVIGNSRLNTGFFETFMKYLVGRDPNAHQFSLTNAAKDISYVNQMAHDAGMANLMSAAAKQYYMHATAIGAGDDYLPMLVDHIAKLNGINIQDEVIKGENDT